MTVSCYLCRRLTFIFTLMKKLLLFLSLISCAGWMSAQSELPSDTLRRAPAENIKEFGGFLLDMGIMKATAPKLPKMELAMPDISKDYNQIFRLDNNARYSQGFTDTCLLYTSPSPRDP